MLSPTALLASADCLMTQFPDLAEEEAERLINVASESIEQELARPLGFAKVPTSAPERIPGSGSLELHLPRWPIREVEELRIDGQLVADFEILDAGSVLYRVNGWPLSAQATGRLVRDPDPRLLERSISVAYSAGYILPQWDGLTNATHNPNGLPADLPASFQQACLWACQDWLERPTPGLIAERTPGGWSQQWAQGEAPILSRRVKDLLGSDGGFWF